MYIPNIGSFADFCSYHANGQPIYFVDGRLYAGFDMLGRLDIYRFTDMKTRAQVEKAISENMHMFDVEEVNSFYYPNDNMFSRDNSKRHIKGYVLYLKDQYK